MKKIVNKLLQSVFGIEIIRHRSFQDGNKSIYSKRLTLYKTKTGDYYLPTDAMADAVANAIKTDAIFDEEIVNIATKYIQRGTVVLDVGSNFGQMSILFSNLVGEKGMVHAFDADDWIFEILKKNIAANGKESIVTPHFGAVHDVNDETLLYPVQDFEKFGSYGSYGIDPTATAGRKVKSYTIDSLNIEGAISFMKVDVQGGDLNVLKGAVKTIEKNKMPILFEYEYQVEDDFGLCFQDYVDFVRSINYKFHKVVNGHNYLIIPQK
jgi:FkbM family methyltransferase